MGDRGRERRDAINAAVAKVKGATVDFTHGGGRLHAAVMLNGYVKRISVSRTSRDGHATKNAVADVRKALKVMAALPPCKPPLPFDQSTSWNTPGFIEAFRVHKG